MARLRPALEAAFAVARAGLDADPPVPPPTALRPFLSFRRLSGRALDRAAKVLDEDEAFRERVRDAVEADAVGDAGWLYLDRPDGWQDRLVRGIAVLGVSLPNFWVAFLLVVVFSVTLGWLPAMGRGGAAHLAMPALAIGLMSLSVNARLLRASMLEAGRGRHVLYARLRGLSEGAVARRHVFRNALVPVVTATGMHVGELLGGALVVETIFSWPGVGRYAVSAIYDRDYPVIQCFTLVMTMVFVLCNLAVDLAYAWLDPRLRLGQEAA